MRPTTRRNGSVVQRLFDLMGCVFLLLLFTVPALIIALLIWLKLGRPIFFTQTRPGLASKPFQLLKFRSMRAPLCDDEPEELRLTSFGRRLRASHLDELPQLWNVLRGEMALVGPRPLLMDYLPLYNSRQARRHQVKPGLTGTAELAKNTPLTWQQRLELDVWYVENRAFKMDLKIITLTLARVLMPKKASTNEFEKFKGNAQNR